MLGERPVIATHFGLECRWYPTVMDGPVFRWTYPKKAGGFQVSASRNGVMVCGHSATYADVGELCELLRLAQGVHQQLAKGVKPAEVTF